MNRFFYLWVICLVFNLNIHPSRALSEEAMSESHAAFGLGGVWSLRGSLSEVSAPSSFVQSSPELVGYLYHPLRGNSWLRAGGRMTYSWDQPDMPRSVKIHEYDLKTGVELGVLYNWAVIPSFVLGAGVIYRTTTWAPESPVVVSEDAISGKSVLPYLQAQLGLGIPLYQGWLVLEPYGRYIHIFGDSRLRWAMGAEATVSVF